MHRIFDVRNFIVTIAFYFDRKAPFVFEIFKLCTTFFPSFFLYLNIADFIEEVD